MIIIAITLEKMQIQNKFVKNNSKIRQFYLQQEGRSN